MATKKADQPQPEPNTPAAAVAEEQAVKAAMQGRVTDTKAGPVLHVPTTIEEATKVANAENAQVTEAVAKPEDAVPAGERWYRVASWDGPVNTNERNQFDPLKPDVVSTNPSAGSIKE